jgi:hypothetical protein
MKEKDNTRDFYNEDDKKPESAKEMDASRKGIDLFFGEKERKFFNNAGREIVNEVLKESFLYYRVDYKKTKTHSLYGEAKKKVFEPEVEIFGRINVESGSPEYMAPGGIIKKGFGAITAEVYNSHLEELQVKIRMGDFMYHKGHYYEIIDDGSSNISNEHAYGGDKLFYISIKGIRVKDDMFQAR